MSFEAVFRDGLFLCTYCSLPFFPGPVVLYLAVATTFSMIYRNYIPNPALARYIKCYWSLRSDKLPLQASRERVFPDGCIELLFHFGDPFIRHLAGQPSFVQPRSFIHGQIKAYIEIEASGRMGIFSVRFQPDGLRAFTSLPVNETTGSSIAIEDIWRHEGAMLEEQVLNAATDEQRVAILEHFLLHQLQQQDEDPVVTYCVASIRRSNGAVGIQQLADAANIGRRHLERRFISGVGISPKLLSRITRFQHTLQLLEQKQFTSLTSLAYEGGFYDQAHFIKDFKEFTGLNPRLYFSTDLDVTKYLSL